MTRHVPRPGPAARIALGAALLACAASGAPAQTPDVRIVRIGTGVGYSTTDVNSISFRTDPLATHGDTQYAAWYDENSRLWIGKRRIGSTAWTVADTGYTSNVTDSHRVACLAVDGDGYLHLSWGHHVEPLNYVRSTAPGALTLTGRLPMDGLDPGSGTVTYPEFFYLPDGNLLFTYRLGVSGNGDTYIQRYDRATQSWTRLHNPTILGRTGSLVNAYPNGMVLDARGRFHWTWTWRDEPGATGNHDQVYARSPDFGTTWTRNDGTPYALPITEATGEVVWPIPIGVTVGNQSHMAVDRADRPMIAQYYDPGGGARVMLTWWDGAAWRSSQVTGPVGWTRPLVVVDRHDRVLVFFVVAAVLKVAYTTDPDRLAWTTVSLASSFKGTDPVFDRKRFDMGDGLVNVFYQRRDDASVHVLEWDPTSFDPPPPPPPQQRAPVADTYVRDGVYSGLNFGTEDRVLVKLDRADYRRESFLRFDVSGAWDATSAVLRLMPVAVGTDAATTTLAFERIDDDAWGEAAMTWSNRPTGAGELLAERTGFATGLAVTLDLTDAVRAEAARDGVLSLRIVSTVYGAGHIVHLASREHALPVNRPVLTVELPSPAGAGAVGAGLRVGRSPGGAGELLLEWSPGCLAGATTYGIHEGTLLAFASHAAVDCFDDGADLAETLAPGPGDRYFLVVPLDAYDEGSYGTDSEGNERPPGTARCLPTQTIAACP
jgi:hypothetical protein